MKKQIGILGTVLLLCMSLAMAAPGFHLTKDTTITGDWEWDGSWQKTYPATATYELDVHSKMATFGGYNEVEVLGTPWKYKLTSNMMVDAPGVSTTKFNVWTVNDPVTTPATGGYTTFKMQSDNYGEFTSSSLKVYGEGAASVTSKFVADSAFFQDNYFKVN